MADATPAAGFACADLTLFCRLDGSGLQVTGQGLEPDRAVLSCRVVEPDPVVPTVRLRGSAAGHGAAPVGSRAVRMAADDAAGECAPLPVHGLRPRLAARHQRAAEPRARLSRRGLRWALDGLVVQHLTIARVAAGLGVAWNTANDAVLAEGKRLLINDDHRFDGVRVIGVDEHAWRHTRRGAQVGHGDHRPVTAIRDGTGPARLLDMVQGRSKQAFKQWLSERDQSWRDAVEVVAMDGFTGFKTATTEELPDAVPVMDPCHVVRLAGDALDCCRRRVQQQLHGHRGRSTDPLYRARRTLHTGADLLTDRQRTRSAETACSPAMRTSRSKPPGPSTKT